MHFTKHFLIFFFLFVSLWGNSVKAQQQENIISLNPKKNNSKIVFKYTLQDSLGYIWMMHVGGILKYDGNKYSNISNKEVFPGKFDPLKKIAKDGSGKIWALSQKGMVSHLNSNGKFSIFKQTHPYKIQLMHPTNNKIWFVTNKGTILCHKNNSSQLDSITSIPAIHNYKFYFVDMEVASTGELFISTSNGKVFIYSPKSGKLQILNGPCSNTHGDIRMAITPDNQLWIGTEGMGLFCYQVKDRKFIQHPLIKANKNLFKNELFLTLFVASDSAIWVGTDGGGLFKIDLHKKKISTYRHSDQNHFSLNSNTILHINEDDKKNIWVTNNYGGINIILPPHNWLHYHSGSTSQSPVRVLSSLRSSNGTLWIGTGGSGITRVDGLSGKTTQHLSRKEMNKNFYIFKIIEDKLGNLWIGTYKNGLWYYNSTQKKFSSIPLYSSISQSATDIRYLYNDSQKRIWAATNLGIFVYSEGKKQLAYFENNSHGLNGLICQSIVEDANNNIWLGYYQEGLYKLNNNNTDLSNSHFSKHPFTEKHHQNNVGESIQSMDSDSKGYLWIVNQYGNLIRYNTVTGQFNSFSHKGPLNGIQFVALVVENPNSIWLSSFHGIWNLQPSDTLVSNLTMMDGLKSNIFQKRSSQKDSKGNIYFGSVNGLNYFSPGHVSKKEWSPKLYINNIEILNQPANNIIPEQISSPIEQITSLKLKPSQSSFSFQFSVVNPPLSNKYQYKYRLKGFDKNWIKAKSDQIATYTNISPGEYTFEVKAGTKQNTWNIPAKTIKIYIPHPWWNQYWAYGIYAIILFFITYGLITWLRLKDKLLWEERERQNEKRLFDLKMNFFTKMSHEIQTPLTLILGPLEDMVSNARKAGNLLLLQRLFIIENNAKRLSRITTQLTELRDKELGYLRLRTTYNDLIDHVKTIVLSFEEQARFKNIEFTQEYLNNSLQIWYDRDKIEHVVYNLLSNAFKYTPKEGNIQLIIEIPNTKEYVHISIINSGPGILQEELEDIFTLFYQSKKGIQAKGYGIGLALSKELIDLHHGQIDVTSSPKDGTSFSICLPLDESIYKKEEKIILDTVNLEIPEQKLIQETISNYQHLEYKHNKTILIVDDELEMQIFLSDIFSKYYKTITACNGIEGIQQTKDHDLDLIISDVMMPQMGGIEMCQVLQNKKSTNHIPIVLLTASNITTKKILGLKSGAVEYVKKPFNVQELLLKVNNLITNKDRLTSKYKTEFMSSPLKTNTLSKEDLFMNDIIQALNTQLDNPNFKLEELSQTLNMSYSAIYRKHNAITGKTLVDFFRQMRLKKSALLITKYNYSISEASFSSGFNDPLYFSKCFKKEFGKSPMKFKKEAEKIGIEKYLKNINLNVE